MRAIKESIDKEIKSENVMKLNPTKRELMMAKEYMLEIKQNYDSKNRQRVLCPYCACCTSKLNFDRHLRRIHNMNKTKSKDIKTNMVITYKNLYKDLKLETLISNLRNAYNAKLHSRLEVEKKKRKKRHLCVAYVRLPCITDLCLDILKENTWVF